MTAGETALYRNRIMKIIGTTANGFLLEASEQETYNLVGHYSRYTEDVNLKPGCTIQVSAMFKQLYNMKNGRVVSGPFVLESTHPVESLMAVNTTNSQTDERNNTFNTGHPDYEVCTGRKG